MDIQTTLEFGLALIIVLALMGGLALLLKRLNNFQAGITGQSSRLKIIEQRMIDPKNKLVILQCDGKDHLVLVGENAQTVIEKDLRKDVSKPE